MWFNRREQKPEDNHQIELARDWARRHTPLILTLIEASTQKAIGLLADDESDIAWDLRRHLASANPHERPLCHPVIENIPDNALAPGMTKQIGKKLFVRTDHMDLGYAHSDITLGDIHIDPTFGQFFPESFGWTIKNHPKLFQNGILVAHEKEIEKAFHIHYE